MIKKHDDFYNKFLIRRTGFEYELLEKTDFPKSFLSELAKEIGQNLGNLDLKREEDFLDGQGGYVTQVFCHMISVYIDDETEEYPDKYIFYLDITENSNLRGVKFNNIAPLLIELLKDCPGINIERDVTALDSDNKTTELQGIEFNKY
jgi:hypothetical protein